MLLVPFLEALIPLRQISQFLRSIIFSFSLGANDPVAYEVGGKSASAGILQTVLQPIILSSLLLSFYSRFLFILTYTLSLSTAWIEVGLERELCDEEFLHSTDVFSWGSQEL